MEPVLSLTMNPAIDVGVSVERLMPDAKLRSDTVQYQPGGGGINVARGIHRLGGDACALFNGDDLFGGMLESLLAEEGVACRRLPIQGRVRESILLEVRSAGELYHVVLPGTEMTDAEVRYVVDAVTSHQPAPAYLVASGGLPAGVDDAFYARLARAAQEQDMRLVLDCHGAPLRGALEEQLFLIKPNVREFAELVGAEASGIDQVAEQSRALLERYPLEVLIVTLGKRGALMTTADEQVHMCPPETERVSPVGAGDSFIAACVHRLAAGGSLRDALRAGVAGAAAAVTTPFTELFDVEQLREVTEQTHEVPLPGN